MGEAVEHNGVSVVYDLYLLLAMMAIHFANIRNDIRFKLGNRKKRKLQKSDNNSESNVFFHNRLVLLICIISPIISMIVKQNWRYYLIYAMTEIRGVGENYSLFSINNLLLLSLWAFCMVFFNLKRSYKKIDIIIILLYSFIIAWICGKRYIIANMGFMYMFFLVQSEQYNKKIENAIKKAIPIAAIILVLFSVYYLTNFKNSVLLTTDNSQAVYETLRADFGRDDVTKYVIKKEFFDNDSFLDYPFQSFSSALFVWVPRSIWKGKPYQHFEYLTASIKNVPLTNHGAGITPSWFEMCIANFKMFGFLVGLASIPIMCKVADDTESIEMKSILLMMIIALLTQSIDAYIIYIAIIMMSIAYNAVLGKKRIGLKRDKVR